MPASATAASYVESRNPATGEVLGRFDSATVAEIPQYIRDARAAQREWAAHSLSERCAFISGLKDALFARRHEVAEAITREVGKPKIEALLGDVMVALDTAAYFGDAQRVAHMLRPEETSHGNLAMKSKRGALRYEPYGVIGIISPWNYPLAVSLGQIIPALVAGNTVLLKPSEFTPHCGAIIGELCAEASLPAGALQILQGRGDVGAALLEPPEADASARSSHIDKLVFTGSVPTGRKVAEACARHLIPSVLELGGKDAMIVLADADLEIASSAAVWGSFTNCGQACLSVERIYIEESTAQRFTDLCVAKTKKLRVGNPLDPDVEIGPMINETQVARVERQLQDAVSRGAKILTGGSRSPLGPCFFEPTVVTNVTDEMLLLREETFGPVLVICPVRDAQEAVARANNSIFGLAASVWTRDAARGEAIAAELTTGVDGERRNLLLWLVRSAARRARRLRLGTHAFTPWSAGDGSSKIRGRGAACAPSEVVVVRLQRKRTCRHG